MSRKKTPSETEHRLLTKSRRRCALCWGLNHELGVKSIQLGHIDRDHTNNKFSNLAPLCLPCHDLYDTEPRQTKRFTPKELAEYRDELFAILSKKRQVVESAFLGESRYTNAKTNSERLGLVVEAFDEDAQRQKSNGLRLQNLSMQFAAYDGDFVAAQEGVRSLLRLMDLDNSKQGEGANFVFGQLALPKASPLVSCGKTLAELSKIDGSLFLSLTRLASEHASYGESRRGLLTADEAIPRQCAASVSTMLYGLVTGRFGEIDEWAQDVALRDLAGLISRNTLAHLYQGMQIPRSIPIRCLNQSGGRVAPPQEALDGNLDTGWSVDQPTDVWFSCLNAFARLPPPTMVKAVAKIPDNFEFLNHVFICDGTSGPVSIERAIERFDGWIFRCETVLGLKINLTNAADLGGCPVCC